MSNPSNPNNPNPDQPELKLSSTPDYRSSYANSVQVRMSVWDFFLVFGTMHQESQSQVAIENFQGIYLSPQQAKALWNVLGNNLAQYEQTFGALALEPKSENSGEPRFVVPIPQRGGPVN
ncbi:hypothetical protein HDF16_000745 [Granulicella aggregans]|uniref:DUF3467 domain-containing protein n=1 Tax=Granulicella aggregans TaxID=474949 RepID=A0A7W7Z9Z7_9BACT|nr:DUF3467 domain-containing protein [Granulicella aggregans]MBB5056076.1 hypothetical protein [Granulicella aggregans]